MTSQEPRSAPKPLKYWSLTVSQNIKALCTPDRMRTILDEFAKSWVFQKEKGATTSKLHYQIRVIMEEGQLKATMLNIFTCRGIDRQDLTFLPESNNSIKQGGLSFYVMKDETRVEGPWHDSTYKVRKRKTYEGRDLACMASPFPWQQTIIVSIEGNADDRSINWVVNVAGCAGKSKLMKYLRFMDYDMCRVPLGTATQIKTSVVAKGPHTCYMVDLPRVRGSDERQSEIFSALEEVKNGWVETAMYGQHAELLMEPPHIWCFSNEWPNPALASIDRWKVWLLEDGVMRLATRSEHIQFYTAQVQALRAAGPSS